MISEKVVRLLEEQLGANDRFKRQNGEMHDDF